MRPQGQAEPKGGPPRRNGWTWLEQRLLSNGGLGPKSGQAKPPGQAGSWANASESGKIKGSPGMSFQHPFAGHFLVQMAKATTQDQRYIFKKKKKTIRSKMVLNMTGILPRAPFQRVTPAVHPFHPIFHAVVRALTRSKGRSAIGGSGPWKQTKR